MPRTRRIRDRKKRSRLTRKHTQDGGGRTIPLNMACRQSSECESGLTCHPRLLLCKLKANQRCSTSSACASGVCQASKCVAGGSAALPAAIGRPCSNTILCDTTKGGECVNSVCKVQDGLTCVGTNLTLKDTNCKSGSAVQTVNARHV